MLLSVFRLLQNQLDKVEKELKKKEKTYQQEINDLRKENDKQQKFIGQVREFHFVFWSSVFVFCNMKKNSWFFVFFFFPQCLTSTLKIDTLWGEKCRELFFKTYFEMLGLEGCQGHGRDSSLLL